jgi:hypothetical protein
VNHGVNLSRLGGSAQPFQELGKFLLCNIDLSLGTTKINGDRAGGRDGREVDLDIRMRLSEVLDVTRFVQIDEGLARVGATNWDGGRMRRGGAL